MLTLALGLGLAAASADTGVEPEGPTEVQVSCAIEEGDDGFIPRFLDATIDQQENGTPIDPDLMQEVSEAVFVCASTDEYRGKGFDVLLDEVLGPPIAAELAKRLNAIGVSAEEIDEIARDDDGVYRSPKQFGADSKQALARHMALIDPADRERAVIYLILYIDTQATIHRL